MKKERTDAVGIREIARILGVARQTAYIYVKTGDIPGGEFVAGKLWVAPRSEVLAFKEQRELRKAA